MNGFEHETDVATLREAVRLLTLENERLSRLNLELQKALAEAKGERVEQLELEIAKLQQTVAARNQALFGDSSERRPARISRDCIRVRSHRHELVAGGEATRLRTKAHSATEHTESVIALRLNLFQLYFRATQANQPDASESELDPPTICDTIECDVPRQWKPAHILPEAESNV